MDLVELNQVKPVAIAVDRREVVATPVGTDQQAGRTSLPCGEADRPVCTAVDLADIDEISEVGIDRTELAELGSLLHVLRPEIRRVLDRVLPTRAVFLATLCYAHSTESVGGSHRIFGCDG